MSEIQARFVNISLETLTIGQEQKQINIHKNISKQRVKAQNNTSYQKISNQNFKKAIRLKSPETMISNELIDAGRVKMSNPKSLSPENMRETAKNQRVHHANNFVMSSQPKDSMQNLINEMKSMQIRTDPQRRSLDHEEISSLNEQRREIEQKLPLKNNDSIMYLSKYKKKNIFCPMNNPDFQKQYGIKNIFGKHKNNRVVFSNTYQANRVLKSRSKIHREKNNKRNLELMKIYNSLNNTLTKEMLEEYFDRQKVQNQKVQSRLRNSQIKLKKNTNRQDKRKQPLNMTIDIGSSEIFDNLKEQSGNELLDDNFLSVSRPISRTKVYSPDIIIARSNSIIDDELCNIRNCDENDQALEGKNSFGQFQYNVQSSIPRNAGLKTNHVKTNYSISLKNKKKAEIK